MTASDQASDLPTPDRIRSAAIDLFSERGYADTTLRQIADAVGVQVGSLYNHISSKEELLFDIMHGIMEELIESTVEALDEAGDDPGARLLAFMQSSISFHGNRKAETFIGNTELRALSPERRAAVVELRDSYEQLLQDALVEGRDRGVIDVADVRMARFAALAICTHVATWYRPDDRLDIDDISDLLPRSFSPVDQHLSRRG